MPDADLDLTPANVARHEYTADSPMRHRSASSRSSSSRRLLFFSLATTWGFMAGAGGLLAAMEAVGQNAHLTSWSILGLVPALAVAIAGAWVLAAAYKEARRRARH